MWLIVSSLSLHNLHLLFCCILSTFALTYLVLMTLFCAAIRRDSISLLRLPFLSRVNVFSCEISLVCCLKYPNSCFSSHFFLFSFVLLVLVLSELFWVALTSLPSALFLCILLVVVSMYRRYVEGWWVLFLLFLTHRVCLCHLYDVRAYASLLVFLFSGPLVEVLPSSL